MNKTSRSPSSAVDVSVVLLGLLSFAVACQSEQSVRPAVPTGKPLVYLIPDTSHYAIIPPDSADLAFCKSQGRSSGATSVSLADIARAEAQLRQVVAQYNEQVDRDGFTFGDFGAGKALGQWDRQHIDLTAYYRQYQVRCSDSGHRLLLIGGQCGPPDDGWRREVQAVQDGGNCYFSLAVDLSQPENLYPFIVNSEA